MSSGFLQGMIAATYTPMRKDGSVNLDRVGPEVERLIRSGIEGMYVCGSTGEGMSLTSEERRAVAKAYVSASGGRVPVIVQVGHNSLADARALATHAQEIGADATSATCPSYFRVSRVNVLVDCMAEIAAGAPDLPFYYYHIPALTGAILDMVEFLQRGADRIRNLFGLKFTDTTLHHFQECVELDGGRFDVVWGCDEMLLGALATGARAAIGSTFNIAAPLYSRIVKAFERDDLPEARRLQSLSVRMIRTIACYPFHPAMKEVLQLLKHDYGRCRLPQPSLSTEQVGELQTRLRSIGFFEWSQLAPTGSSLASC